ncbi:dihydroneopterin aldolase [Phenylobacterium sp. LjRoot219]|uniref:dihydroneopterin aldolase n=1 Tax=Phenylobacterium sp. LjRoot219 TaxID=3342283 RepID=UPI003ED100F1
MAKPPLPAPAAGAVRVAMTKVFVTGLRVQAEIGVYRHEIGKRQPLSVDVELDVPAAGADRLADTVNYETILKAAQAIAAEGHIELVEAFAERLARACIADPRVTRARVRVEKPLALAPDAVAAGAEITLERG